MNRRQPPRGFTLLEVLVALSLSVLLIGAIYAGLNLYFRFSTTGHDDVERALLARSLLRKIEMDVRSAMYTAPQAASSTSSGGSSSSGSSGATSSGSSGSTSGSTGTSGSSTGTSGSSSGGSTSSSSSSTSTTTAPEDAYASSSTGLFGNSTTLLLNVSKPGYEQMAASLAASGNVQTRMSDIATVAYFMAGTGAGALQQSVPGPGLARMEGDRMAMAMADSQSSTSLLASATQVLAPEVASIEFLYWDGFRWRSDWDSSVMQGMPKAIDVKLYLNPVSGRSTTPDMYNLTIAIPLGKPIDTSLITP
ncbi:MAG: prepilin-type N-terminal cleavage/methylation domain-containing protein [Planctomycetia bacterium]|nr:prepilin-type N-terminal cleavage/methylation domain-containing protein [Planctomycetia bacterium]